MLKDPVISAFSIESLAHRCRQEPGRFFDLGSSDDRYCFELFRRALAEQDPLAWELILEQYTPLVTGWIIRHPAFSQAEEEREYFLNRAFERLWHAMTPEKFERMANLKALIAYLKLCVHAALIEHVERRVNREEWSAADIDSDLNSFTTGRDAAAAVRSDMMANHIWACIENTVKTEAETVIARCSFIFDMKPAEICEMYPDLFDDVRLVYRQKENLLARLGRDADLQAILAGHD